MGMRPQELLQNSVVFYVHRAAVPRFSSRDRESFQCTSKNQALNQKTKRETDTYFSWFVIRVKQKPGLPDTTDGFEPGLRG